MCPRRYVALCRSSTIYAQIVRSPQQNAWIATMSADATRFSTSETRHSLEHHRTQCQSLRIERTKTELHPSDPLAPQDTVTAFRRKLFSVRFACGLADVIETCLDRVCLCEIAVWHVAGLGLGEAALSTVNTNTTPVVMLPRMVQNGAAKWCTEYFIWHDHEAMIRKQGTP